MSTVAEVHAQPGHGPANLTAFVDRWIFVFMAALLLAAALAGFIPDSLEKVAAVEAGRRPPFPPVMHMHAVLMGTWLTLLLAQTTLMATGQARYHRQLGMASLVLAPAIVLTGIVLIPTMHAERWTAFHAAAPEFAAQLAARLTFSANILLFQIRAGIVFGALVWLALRARSTDAGLHKRLMILATLVLMPAALDRMSWLPSTLPQSPLTMEIYPLVLLLPMFLWDLYRQRQVHRAYLIYALINAPFVILTILLWNEPWWQKTVPALMGFA